MLSKREKRNRPLAVTRWLSAVFLWLTGFKVTGKRPECDKFILLLAPHTSNWDTPYLLATTAVLGVKSYWMVKDTWFFWPMGILMRAAGGLPIDRSRARNVVGQAVEAFNEWDHLAIGIPPEGTRGLQPHWKSGFYHIALKANVPVACGYGDYKVRACGIGPTIAMTGDEETDLNALRAFYEPITACYPEKYSPIKFRKRPKRKNGKDEAAADQSSE
jgi:1-acyl-sn-glycerol-3-phosphate acyltransferase